MKSRWISVILALLLAACARPPLPPVPTEPWSKVKSFACQLQNFEPTHAPSVDLLIIDPTRDGKMPYSLQEISRLKSGGRLLLGYLSIGEAEDYRDYWQKHWKPGQPSWLTSQNPQWHGNLKVHYWHPAWHELILQEAAKIQAQGFDGLFLDTVDAWEFWQQKKAHPQPKQAMVELVQLLISQGRKSRADFGIFLNGGEQLLSTPGLLNSLDGLVKEEIFFGLNGDNHPSPIDFRRTTQQYLRPMVQAGKLVLSIDYTSDPQQKQQAQALARQAGYLEFIGSRNLDRIPPQY